jgi:hypothetical protein
MPPWFLIVHPACCSGIVTADHCTTPNSVMRVLVGCPTPLSSLLAWPWLSVLYGLSRWRHCLSLGRGVWWRKLCVVMPSKRKQTGRK